MCRARCQLRLCPCKLLHVQARLNNRGAHIGARTAIAPRSRAQVIVKWWGGQAQVHLAIRTSGTVKNMARDCDEPVGKCLARLQSNLAPKGAEHFVCWVSMRRRR